MFSFWVDSPLVDNISFTKYNYIFLSSLITIIFFITKKFCGVTIIISYWNKWTLVQSVFLATHMQSVKEHKKTDDLKRCLKFVIQIG